MIITVWSPRSRTHPTPHDFLSLPLPSSPPQRCKDGEPAAGGGAHRHGSRGHGAGRPCGPQPAHRVRHHLPRGRELVVGDVRWSLRWALTVASVYDASCVARIASFCSLWDCMAGGHTILPSLAFDTASTCHSCRLASLKPRSLSSGMGSGLIPRSWMHGLASQDV